MRSVEVRSAVRAFIDSVISARTFSASVGMGEVYTRRVFDLPSLLRESGALLTGDFRLSSGLHSPNYVQCALLIEEPRNAKAIGVELAERIKDFGVTRVVAPALGGVVIGYTVAQALDLPSIFTERKDGAMTLRRGFRIRDGESVVIVEDVVTTGKSTRETAAVIE